MREEINGKVPMVHLGDVTLSNPVVADPVQPGASSALLRPSWPGVEVLPEPPSIDEVCVIQGPGRGECWGCPVRDCVLWQNPINPLSEETQAVALRAAKKLIDNDTVISAPSQANRISREEGQSAAAYLLATAIGTEKVQDGLRVQMASEAVLQDVVRDAVIKRQRQYTDRWMKGLRGRMPTLDDDARLDALMNQAEADAAAEAYECDAESVLRQLNYFRGRRLVRRGND